MMSFSLLLKWVDPTFTGGDFVGHPFLVNANMYNALPSSDSIHNGSSFFNITYSVCLVPRLKVIFLGT